MVIALEDPDVDGTETLATPLADGTGTQVEEDEEEVVEKGDMSIEPAEFGPEGLVRIRASKRPVEEELEGQITAGQQGSPAPAEDAEDTEEQPRKRPTAGTDSEPDMNDL
jgi:hypothetical protein